MNEAVKEKLDALCEAWFQVGEMDLGEGMDKFNEADEAEKELLSAIDQHYYPRDLVDQLIEAVKDTLETPNPEAPELTPEYDAYVSGLIAQLQGVSEDG